MRWVTEYDRAQRDSDMSGVPALFTEDAQYRTSPYELAMPSFASRFYPRFPPIIVSDLT